jgi:hypothetical protein
MSAAYRKKVAQPGKIDKANGLINIYCVDIFKHACYADTQDGFFSVDGTELISEIQEFERWHMLANSLIKKLDKQQNLKIATHFQTGSKIYQTIYGGVKQLVALIPMNVFGFGHLV